MSLGARFAQSAPDRWAENLPKARPAHAERREKGPLGIRDRTGRGPESIEELVPVGRRRWIDEQHRREPGGVAQNLLQFRDRLPAEGSAEVTQEDEECSLVSDDVAESLDFEILAGHSEGPGALGNFADFHIPFIAVRRLRINSGMATPGWPAFPPETSFAVRFDAGEAFIRNGGSAQRALQSESFAPRLSRSSARAAIPSSIRWKTNRCVGYRAYQ